VPLDDAISLSNTLVTAMYLSFGFPLARAQAEAFDFVTTGCFLSADDMRIARGETLGVD
jgi:hypothetical protein